jgi:hypothetical protein
MDRRRKPIEAYKNISGFIVVPNISTGISPIRLKTALKDRINIDSMMKTGGFVF